jgi:dTDP-glucose 4,6-dehydratase
MISAVPTAVVTGGAGFLGSHLCDALLGKGMQVICIDNLDTGNLENIEHARDGGFVFINQDVTRHIEVEGAVEFVYHLASPASPIDYARLPLHTLKVGSYGTHNALGLAKFKRARFLLASTSEVYGNPLLHPQPESYWGNVNPIGPRGVYDEAKRYAEAMTMAYHRQQGVDTSIVRIFNTYGPRMRPHDGRAIPTFVRQALSDKPLTVFGDGSQTRSFCYVDDLIRGLILLAESSEHRQPERDDPARAGADGGEGDRIEERDRVRGSADGRPAGSQAGHHQGSRAARMGADRPPRARTREAARVTSALATTSAIAKRSEGPLNPGSDFSLARGALWSTAWR